MATAEQLAQALTEVRQHLAEAQRLAMETQRAGSQTTAASMGQLDPSVMNKCPTFSGRDTERSEWSFIFESVAAMANLEPAMEGASTGFAEKPFAELTPEMKLGGKQLYHLLVNTVRRKAFTLVRSAEKDHGIAAWKRIKTEYEPDAAGRHTAMLMGVTQPGWYSRSAANTFLDQLTEWERRVRRRKSGPDGMASHVPESIRNVVWATAQRNGKYRVVRQQCGHRTAGC